LTYEVAAAKISVTLVVLAIILIFRLARGKLKMENICWPISLLIMFILILAEANIVSPVSAQASDPPIQIHLTWSQNDTAHTIVITWKTSNENAGDEVLYDITPVGGSPSLYGSSATGSHHTYSGAGGYVHDVELTGLSPNTIYYFICGGENGGWSEERAFRTAPDQRESFRFVAGGDSRSGGNWPGPRDSISREMAKFNPSFILFTGDFVMQGNYQWEWDNWFAAAQEYWVDNNLTIPIIPCIGNHELSGDIFDNGTLHLQAVGTDGETFDEYYIHKEVPAPEGGLPIVAIVIVSIVVIACAGVAFYLLRIRGKS